MKIIAGLGNPDEKYLTTRHNVGFMAVDEIANQLSFPAFKLAKQLQAATSTSTIDEEKVLMTKPNTYMNLSGNSVQATLSYFKQSPEDLIVIYDDIDLPVGQIRIKQKGSAGTHNGMKSIVSHIGEDFTRIRIGIRGETTFKTGMDLANYVLSSFSREESAVIARTIKTLPIIVKDLLSIGLEKTMSKYNS